MKKIIYLSVITAVLSWGYEDVKGSALGSDSSSSSAYDSDSSSDSSVDSENSSSGSSSSSDSDSSFIDDDPSSDYNPRKDANKPPYTFKSSWYGQRKHDRRSAPKVKVYDSSSESKSSSSEAVYSDLSDDELGGNTQAAYVKVAPKVARLPNEAYVRNFNKWWNEKRIFDSRSILLSIAKDSEAGNAALEFFNEFVKNKRENTLTHQKLETLLLDKQNGLFKHIKQVSRKFYGEGIFGELKRKSENGEDAMAAAKTYIANAVKWPQEATEGKYWIGDAFTQILWFVYWNNHQTLTKKTASTPVSDTVVDVVMNLYDQLKTLVDTPTGVIPAVAPKKRNKKPQPQSLVVTVSDEEDDEIYNPSASEYNSNLPSENVSDSSDLGSLSAGSDFEAKTPSPVVSSGEEIDGSIKSSGIVTFPQDAKANENQIINCYPYLLKHLLNRELGRYDENGLELVNALLIRNQKNGYWELINRDKIKNTLETELKKKSTASEKLVLLQNALFTILDYDTEAFYSNAELRRWFRQQTTEFLQKEYEQKPGVLYRAMTAINEFLRNAGDAFDLMQRGYRSDSEE